MVSYNFHNLVSSFHYLFIHISWLSTRFIYRSIHASSSFVNEILPIRTHFHCVLLFHGHFEFCFNPRPNSLLWFYIGGTCWSSFYSPSQENHLLINCHLLNSFLCLCAGWKKNTLISSHINLEHDFPIIFICWMLKIWKFVVQSISPFQGCLTCPN